MTATTVEIIEPTPPPHEVELYLVPRATYKKYLDLVRKQALLMSGGDQAFADQAVSEFVQLGVQLGAAPALE